MERKHYRQGDVVLEQEMPIAQMSDVPGEYVYMQNTIPNTINTKRMPAAKSVTLAVGEEDGHTHVLECQDEIELFERSGTLYCRLKSDGEVKHPEHATLQIPAGDYKVVRQHEYDPKTGMRHLAD